MSKILLHGGCVLTLGARTPNFIEADVLIDGDRIAEVGPGLRARDAEVVDAADTIVMPGFVDTHRHVWKSLFRNQGGPGGQDSASEALGARFGPDEVYAATLVGLLGAAEAGITTVVDWSDIPAGEAHADAALQAHLDAGLRTVMIHSASDGGETGVALRRLLAARGGSGYLTSIAYGAPDLSLTAGDWATARELGLQIHAHAGREPSSAGVVADLAKRGHLGADVTLIHCSHLGDADLDGIASSGTSVSLTPASEMATGLGSPPMQKLIDRGIRPGLGIDSDRVAPGDMFAQMRSAISLQHATYFDLKLAGKAGLPNLLTTREVIRYATIDGARAVGLGGVTGSLEPGKQADIVVLRADRPNIVPVNDPIGAVVWGMDTSNVDWVFAAGQPVMSNGVLGADVERARTLATEASQRISGLSAVATGGGG